MIGLDTIDQLTARRLGTFDVPCPVCGPLKRSARNKRKPVLRVYRVEPSFAGYTCARCGEKGAALDRAGTPPDPVKLARARAEAAEDARVVTAKRLSTARWLWRRRRPLIDTIAETYLRSARGYGGALPATLGFLPAWRDHPPAVIGAFGLAVEAVEVEPGVLVINDDAVVGVHLIKLKPDGSDRLRDYDLADDEPAKISIGRNFVAPIVLAAPNDLLALTVAEGIEDALNDHQATGRGAWAAGSASRMPALAAVVPGYVESVTVLVDGNKAGRDGSTGLAAGLHPRGIEAKLTPVSKAAIS
jgi:hypothetical protein